MFSKNVSVFFYCEAGFIRKESTLLIPRVGERVVSGGKSYEVIRVTWFYEERKVDVSMKRAFA